MGIKIAGWVLVMVAIAATIGCDRITKHAARTMLAGQPDHSYLADTVRLGYVENSGGFLSLPASWPSAVRTMFFTVSTGVVLLTLAVLAIRQRRDKWSRLGFALFLAGGLSNWVDRIARGSVVDFLNIGVGPVRTGVFNVADAAIMLGLAVFALAEFRSIHRMKSLGAGGRSPSA
jgi:signal peptidase II